MSNWKKKQFYCDECDEWHDAHHMSINDPRAASGKCSAGGGQELIDPQTGLGYCTACGEVHSAEDTVLYCGDHPGQSAQSQEAAVIVEAAEGWLVSDGQQVYLVTCTDVVLGGQRYLTNIRGV